MSIERPHRAGTPSGTTAVQVDYIRRLLVNSWVFDPEFFTKFFPITPHMRKTYQDNQTKMRRGDRWKGIPKRDPKSPSNLYTPLKVFLNDVLLSFELHEDARRFLNTSHSRIHPDTTCPTWPPLFLVGSGIHFVTTAVTRPQPDYAFGISAIEVRLESEDEIPYRDRLATNMQRMFALQFNRRYAFGMVISQRTLTLYMFDRSGVLYSPALDYHSEPEQLFAIISGLASMDASRLGFDTSISFDTEGRISTHKSLGRRKTQEIVYTVYTFLYNLPLLRSRGTICFLVYEESAPKTLYVLKDSWEPSGGLEGRESEASLLAHAQRCGVKKGLVQLVHDEKVHVKTHTGRHEVDSILGNRRIHTPNIEIERTHTRIVITPYGKPLNHFSNRKELLVAFYDALQGHRALYEIAGILHRDIKPNNILITPREEEGNRGMLIDLDFAIRINDTSPYSTQRKIGTYLFMSQNALEGEAPQTCVDDLESFFYVLLFISMSFSGPESPHRETNDLFLDWQAPMAFSSKNGFLFEPFGEEVDPWFGDHFQTLLRELHAIFRRHRMQCHSANLLKIALPILDPAQVYDAFFDHIRRAIAEIDKDVCDIREPEGQSSSDTSKNIRHGRRRRFSLAARAQEEQASQLYSWLKPSESADEPVMTIETTAAATRSRRKGAKYGFTRPLECCD